jgi:3-hydroxy-3-methylglutaryl CoA synthase
VAAKGIVSLGVYIPQRRLRRSAIATALAWTNPNLPAQAKGRRASCAHDEDSLTMAVAAARHCTRIAPAAELQINTLQFASCTHPFSDRQNATVAASALGLPDTIRTQDLAGSLRAGTGALLNALQHSSNTLVVAADKRAVSPGSPQELRFGDAAAAALIGQDRVIARFLGAHAQSLDFTDHYRASDTKTDYALEERWVRDSGHMAVIPAAISQLLVAQQCTAGDIAHLIVGNVDSRTSSSIARALEIDPAVVCPDLRAEVGDSGNADPLLRLASVLQNAAPGELIVLVGVGQGCDVLLFEVTDAVRDWQREAQVQAHIVGGRDDDNYLRYLSSAGHVAMDWGMRDERDSRTAHTAHFRHRHTINAMVGGRCQHCNTPQFPKKHMCVNPACRRLHSQNDEAFASKSAVVKSFTEDWLALSYNPPLMYGNVQFDGGGVVMMEFADFAPGELAVGTPVSMQLRIKDHDKKRGFTRYFWKAVPVAGIA